MGRTRSHRRSHCPQNKENPKYKDTLFKNMDNDSDLGDDINYFIYGAEIQNFGIVFGRVQAAPLQSLASSNA